MVSPSLPPPPSCLELFLRLLRRPLRLHQRLKPPLFVDEEVVVLRVQRDGLLGQPVGHAPPPVVPSLVATLADVVVGAVPAPVPVPDDGHAPAPVAGDALVLAEVVGLLLPSAGSHCNLTLHKIWTFVSLSFFEDETFSKVVEGFWRFICVEFSERRRGFFGNS